MKDVDSGNTKTTNVSTLTEGIKDSSDNMVADRNKTGFIETFEEKLMSSDNQPNEAEITPIEPTIELEFA